MEEWTCNCGTRNTQNFCVNCGKPKATNASRAETQSETSLNGVDQTMPMPTSNQSRDDKKTYIIIGLIVLVLGLCGTVGYLILSNDKDVQTVELPSTKPETIVTPIAVPTGRDKLHSPVPILHDERSDKDTAEPFITLKDSYDIQIAALASDVNDHIRRNVNYQNAYYLLERAEQIVRNIRDTRDRIQQTKFNNERLKNQIIKVLDAEFIRADGIREGIQSSYDGRDWHAGFNRGHNGKIQFDNENAVLVNMVR